MFVRWLLGLLFIVAVLIAGCGGSSDNSESTTNAPIGVAGNWTGTLRQKGIAPFQIAARLDAVGSGRVAYTGIECGGSWTSKRALASSPPFITIEERITEGAGGECKGVGTVTLHLRSATAGAGLEYDFTGGGVTSRGLLHRTDEDTLRQIFTQAGVKPPQ
jgi:hypothetical protein